MQNQINPWISALMLFLMTLNSACASLAPLSPPALENRTLRLSLDQAGLEYQYEVCVKRFLGICTKREMQRDTYDLKDEAVRRKLIDMGFVLKVREKVD